MTKVRSNRIRFLSFLTSIVLSTSAIIATGCNSDDNANRPNNIADSAVVDPTTQVPNNPGNTNSNTMTIAVKYVALKGSSSDAATPSQADVQTLMNGLTSIWSQCDIAFTLDSYSTPVASDDGLVYNVATFAQMDNMRAKYQDGAHALIVKTGTWNRTSDLSGDGSQGYSSMPPSTYEGTIVQADMATSALLLAHELGHLIGGLDHTSGTNLMNHYVSGTDLTQAQCNQVRSTMLQYHAAWIR